MGLDLWRTYFI